ncbi:MAG: MG2 domain-containing protein [Pyrinomonadaceae bacterium MAG19_C2-C3]|nr:MG2 domain-containing protein [Pyrinomonadaceae bacterium MAG19_C2-C3]
MSHTSSRRKNRSRMIQTLRNSASENSFDAENCRVKTQSSAEKSFGMTVTSLVRYVVLVMMCAACFALSSQVEDVRAQTPTASPTAVPPLVNIKPAFSLSTNKSYATSERARFSINYYNIDYLDFRVYRVDDPVTFFRNLRNPHGMGEEDETVTRIYRKREVTFLEKVRKFKNSIYLPVRNYLRGQLQRKSRESFSRTFKSEPAEETVDRRVPLNVADFARVPLLNPQQLVSSWQEKLTPLESEYDRRVISLGTREAGVYVVEAVNGDLRAFTLLVVTDLALITKSTTNKELMVYAVDRQTGAPREGVEVQVSKRKETLTAARTDANGLLRTQVKSPRPTTGKEEQEAGYTSGLLIMAKDARDFAVSDLSIYSLGLDGSDSENTSSLVGYIYTERPVYRPAQKIYFKGILRNRNANGYSLVRSGNVAVRIDDADGTSILETSLPLSPRGTFNGEVEVAEDAPLGSYNITASVEGESVGGYFEVQEYKKPEYKVTVRPESKYATVGTQTKFTIEARYFFGAPVTRADVKYYVYRSRYYHWRTEDEDDYADEYSESSAYGDEGYGGYDDDIVQEGEGKLDREGRLIVPFTVPAPDAKQPYDFKYRLEAQVTDAARRTNEAQATFIGTRGSVTTDVEPDRYVYQRGDFARLRVRTSDYEGRPRAVNLKLQFVQELWDAIETEDDGGKYPRYRLREKLLSTYDIATNAQGEATFDYQVPVVGSITIKSIVNENGRDIVTASGYLWATDTEGVWDEDAYQDTGGIKLILDKKTYQPGETARVLAILPTNGTSHLLVTTELDRVLSVRRITTTGRAVMIDVPIEARYTPNAFLSVAYIRGGEMYTQDRTLSVPPRDKMLNVEIIPNKQEYKPREVASYTVSVRNHDGTPAANAEVSLGVVDEAVYEIRGESAGDMRETFYGRRYNSVSTSFASYYYFTGYSGKEALQLAGRAAKRANLEAYADVKNDLQYAEPVIRKIFKDTALWQPNVLTGSDGRANVQVELPDNLTTWRATARAVTSDLKVGSTTTKTLARKDLILRLALPRFLTEGDTVTVSGIVHNYLKTAKTTKISLEVDNGEIIGTKDEIVSIPQNGEHRLDFQLRAPRAGQLRFLAKALTDTESDAIELPLEVIPRGLEQTRGGALTVLEADAEREFTLELPANANTEARTLRIEAAPSISNALFGALDYLVGYPYGCTEQTLSQFVPTVIVAQVLQNTENTRINDRPKLNAMVAQGFKRLYVNQNADGGWGWWRDEKSNPFMTAYAVDGLTMARDAGYAVDSSRLDSARQAMLQMLDKGRTEDDKPYDLETRAYLIYALNKIQFAPGYTNQLFNLRKDLQPYGRALLALTLHQANDSQRAREVLSELESMARVNNFDAHWESTRQAERFMSYTEINDVEATALAVKALARIAPESELLPKAARWLAQSRGRGTHWLTTKQTAFAVYALADYLKVSQEQTPDYTLEIYLDGEQVLARQITTADVAGGQSFTLERKNAQVKPVSRVRIVKRGAGALYLASQLTYFSREETTNAQSSNDLKITRDYYRLRIAENKEGELKWTPEPLSGDVRSGDLIVSRLRIAGARGRYVMVEDPIPAGCEQITTSSGIEFDKTNEGWTDWYSGREFRDERTAFFLDFFDGDATFNYVLRVQTPGEFRIAPARAEFMYQPTVAANTATGSLKINDR